MFSNGYIYVWLTMICRSCETEDQAHSAYNLLKIAKKNKYINEDDYCTIYGYLSKGLKYEL